MLTPGCLSLARMRRGLTKKGFAEVLGVTPHTVLRYESGEISPSPETLEQSARFARHRQRRVERSPGYNPHTSPVCGSGFCGPMPGDIHRPDRRHQVVSDDWFSGLGFVLKAAAQEAAAGCPDLALRKR
ncbi:XRE family transcriptional regulator (plasmid) [Rhizobium ruizarguesonis]|nr:XRE family transcriptional regulator [Rhizobium ruizarguesonis]TAU51300.1 XRE family transcriptional regulator [Rhizobium ruizarguesonis]